MRGKGSLIRAVSADTRIACIAISLDRWKSFSVGGVWRCALFTQSGVLNPPLVRLFSFA